MSDSITVPSKYQMRVFADVHKERLNQDAKWGPQNHPPLVWLPILMEEVGEASQAALHIQFGGHKTAEDYREELVQVAAVAVAMIECLDRNYSCPPK